MKTIYKKDIKAMVKKFGLDEFEAREVEIMAESINEENKLQETTWKLAKLLKCSSYHLQQWFKGFACNKNRFGQFVECSDTYGLNYLEIA